jgi:hypothetical protein
MSNREEALLWVDMATKDLRALGGMLDAATFAE